MRNGLMKQALFYDSARAISSSVSIFLTTRNVPGMGALGSLMNTVPSSSTRRMQGCWSGSRDDAQRAEAYLL